MFARPIGMIGKAATLLDRRQPLFLVFSVTARCNASCPFCFYRERVESADPAGELDTVEVEEISRRCGFIPYLLISGGEPVLREDLADLIGFFVRNAGSAFVTVPSNGLSPDATSSLFTRLLAEHPRTHFRAAFSIDFPDERHDAARGAEGCLASLVETASRIAALRDRHRNLTMEAVSVFAPWNAAVMSDLRRWVGMHIRPDNHELHALRADWPSIAAAGLDREAFLAELALFRKEGRQRETRPLSPFFRSLNDTYHGVLESLYAGLVPFACRAGERIVTLGETGDVRLCELRPEILGNVRDYGCDLRRLLHDGPARRAVRAMQRGRCACTWECAVSTNIVFTARFYPGLLAGTIRHLCARAGGAS